MIVKTSFENAPDDVTAIAQYENGKLYYVTGIGEGHSYYHEDNRYNMFFPEDWEIVLKRRPKEVIKYWDGKGVPKVGERLQYRDYSGWKNFIVEAVTRQMFVFHCLDKLDLEISICHTDLSGGDTCWRDFVRVNNLLERNKLMHILSQELGDETKVQLILDAGFKLEDSNED